MSKKKKRRKRNRNPLLAQKWDEGYQQGKKDGVEQAVQFFRSKFEGLEDVPGIGDKTLEKVKIQLGRKYFE